MLEKNLKKQFVNTYKFSNHDVNKFILMLQKVFTHLNTWMIKRNSMKHYYQRNKIFTVC